VAVVCTVWDVETMGTVVEYRRISVLYEKALDI